MRTTTFTSAFAGLLLTASSVYGLTSSLVQVTNFGSNPTGVGIYLYKPTTVVANPPLILALHYCTGTAQAYFQGTTYAQLADQYGYLVLYGNAPTAGGCWDVATNATLTHNAGGDSLGLASAVRYAIANYGVDASKVFVTGTSSGAMMTEVMAGAYPDLFNAGAIFSGEPYGCFAGPSAWNSQCSTGQLTKTAQQWGDQVRSGYPGYTGARPRLQNWHGTADTTLAYQSLIEANKEWSNVLGVTFTKNVTNTPLPGYTEMIYGDGTKYVAYSALNVGHTVPEQEGLVLQFFGITGGLTTSPTTTSQAPPPTTTVGTTLSTKTTVAPITTTAPSKSCSALYAQCGGIGWTGPTCCASGSTCKASNSYYSQCL